jgi:hypothetical protein
MKFVKVGIFGYVGSFLYTYMYGKISHYSAQVINLELATFGASLDKVTRSQTTPYTRGIIFCSS